MRHETSVQLQRRWSVLIGYLEYFLYSWGIRDVLKTGLVQYFFKTFKNLFVCQKFWWNLIVYLAKKKLSERFLRLLCFSNEATKFFYESSNTSIYSIKDKVVVCSRVRTKFLNHLVFLNIELIVGLLALLHLLPQ